MSGSDPWRIVHLDLEKPLRSFSAGPGLHLELWWRQIPLGRLWISRDELPMGLPELRRSIAHAIAPTVGFYTIRDGFRPPFPVMGDNPARDHSPDLSSLASIENPLATLQDSPPPPLFRVSVLVCTRSRPEPLRRCLENLVALDPPADEILVIDNTPGESETRRVVGDFPGVIRIEEPRPGLSRARNAGIRAATGDLLAWTDDDVLVTPQWLAAIRRVFADPSVSASTGLVLPGRLDTEAQVQFERDFGGFSRGFRPLRFDHKFFQDMCGRGVPVWQIGAGANMAFRREVFDQVGLFDERLGAGASGCSEDSELWYRLLAAGHSIQYEPLAVVRHDHRAENAAFRQQRKLYMRGHAAALLVQYEKHRHPGNLRRLFFSLPRHYWRVLTRFAEGAERASAWDEAIACFNGTIYYLLEKLRGRQPYSPLSDASGK